MKKIIAVLTSVILAVAALVSCSDRNNMLSGFREGLYFEFESSGSDMYEVRYRRIEANLSTFFTGSNENWSQPIDNQLIRFYEDEIVRFDILGLTPGLYEVKITGINHDSIFWTPSGFEKIVGPINVYAHSRIGFAFFNQKTNELDLNLASGAYYPDGRLRTNANVLYIYDENIDVVSVTIDNVERVGLYQISSALQFSNEPWNIRIVGKVTLPVFHNLGEILFSNVNTGLTIEGVGNDAVVYGWQIGINYSTNVEIRNLAFKMSQSVEGDSLNINHFNTHIHIHNNEFFYADTHSLTGAERNRATHFKGDGSTDFVRTTNVTLGYNIYWDTGKTILIGNTPDRLYHTDFFTVHSNWFNHSDTRHPRVRAASTVHVFNNFYDGVSGAGIGSTFGATVISEANYFLNTNRPFVISNQGNDAVGSHLSNEPGGFIASLNDIIRTDRTGLHNQQNNGNPRFREYNYHGFFPQWDALRLDNRNSNVSREIRVNSTVNDDHHNNPETGSSRYFNNFHIELADVMPNARPANQVPDYVRSNAGRIGRAFEFDFEDAAIFTGAQHRNADLDYFLRNYTSTLTQIGFGYVWPEPPLPLVPIIDDTPPLPETELVQTLWLTGDGTVPGRQQLNVYLSHPSVHRQGTNAQGFNPQFRSIADATRPFACNDSHRVPMTVPGSYIANSGPEEDGGRVITHGLRFPVGNGFEIYLEESMYIVLFFSRIHGDRWNPNIEELVPASGTSRLYMNGVRARDNVRPNTHIPAGDGVFSVAKIILPLDAGWHTVHRPQQGMNEITLLMMMFFER